jgi:proteasome accessory factor A
LLHGDTNVLPTTLLLKAGTTALVLDLLELDQLPRITLSDAVMTFRNLSHQPDAPWLAPLSDGRCANAVELLFQYQEAARKEFRGRDTETDIVLRIWEEVLSALATEPEMLVGKVDWITKRWLFREFMERENISWSDPWLKAQDLEFHHADPGRSLGLALARTPLAWDIPASDITDAMRTAPHNTRAQARSHIMKLLKNQHIRYFVDWEVIDAEGVNSLNLLNPFDASPDEAENWAKQLNLV